MIAEKEKIVEEIKHCRSMDSLTFALHLKKIISPDDSLVKMLEKNPKRLAMLNHYLTKKEDTMTKNIPGLKIGVTIVKTCVECGQVYSNMVECIPVSDLSVFRKRGYKVEQQEHGLTTYIDDKMCDTCDNSSCSDYNRRLFA